MIMNINGDLQEGKLVQAGKVNILTNDECDTIECRYAIVIEFQSVEALRKALNDGKVSFEWY